MSDVDLAGAPVARATIGRELLVGLLALLPAAPTRFRAYVYADGEIVLHPLDEVPPVLRCPVEGCARTGATERALQVHMAMMHPDWLPPPADRPAPPVTNWDVVLVCGECPDSRFPSVGALHEHTTSAHGRMATRAERTPQELPCSPSPTSAP